MCLKQAHNIQLQCFLIINRFRLAAQRFLCSTKIFLQSLRVVDNAFKRQFDQFLILLNICDVKTLGLAHYLQIYCQVHLFIE